MILGRSTGQWTALITATAGLGQLLVVTLLPGIDPIVLATVIGATVMFLGVFLAFLANTAMTPINDARLEKGTEVTVLERGKITGDTVIVQPSPPGPVGIEGGAAIGNPPEGPQGGAGDAA